MESIPWRDKLFKSFPFRLVWWHEFIAVIFSVHLTGSTNTDALFYTFKMHVENENDKNAHTHTIISINRRFDPSWKLNVLALLHFWLTFPFHNIYAKWDMYWLCAHTHIVYYMQCVGPAVLKLLSVACTRAGCGNIYTSYHNTSNVYCYYDILVEWIIFCRTQTDNSFEILRHRWATAQCNRRYKGKINIAILVILRRNNSGFFFTTNLIQMTIDFGH